ncbi:Uncharacterized protein FWK35_00030136 [Aphis craccivora]|uniref:Uncharacterized protein n=1 Tax=Aphis craccivora TaxID=307492 RepID=A0A6G0Z9C6_APHCR|nr:Uncharacterized protein FWK35_00030136 [Aphis craccivora]
MSINTKSPIKKSLNNFFATKTPNNLHLNSKTIKTPNNNLNITANTSNPKTNSTPLLNNNLDQSTPKQTPPILKTSEKQISFANHQPKLETPPKKQALII